jgi:hypothetical protein
MVYAKQTLLFHYNIFDSKSNVEEATHFKEREIEKLGRKDQNVTLKHI